MPDRAPTFELAFQLSGELVGREMLTEEDLKGLSEEETAAKLRENAALLAEVYTLLEHDAICIQYLNPAHIARTAALLREMTGDRFLLLAHGDCPFPAARWCWTCGKNTGITELRRPSRPLDKRGVWPYDENA